MEQFAGELVAEKARTRSRIPGFGHPVFKKVDPRAAILRQVAVDAGLWSGACELYEEIHRVFTTPARKADIPINDIGMMAAVLTGLGFTPEESTGITIISTLPGVVAHISEELRSGRPIRIVPDETASYEVEDGRDFADDWEAAGWNREA
jgi:citrate synthase